MQNKNRGSIGNAVSLGAAGALKMSIVENRAANIKDLLSKAEYMGRIEFRIPFDGNSRGLIRIENLESNEVKEFRFTYVNAISKGHYTVQDGDVDILSITFE